MILLEILVTGLVATAVLDLWQQIFLRITGLPITNWAMIGRWAGHMREGQFVQADIGKAAPVANEAALGWAIHYVVGIGYALVYLVLMRLLGIEPGFVPAMIFGAVSVAVTWFAMEPILGAGAMASRTPKPELLRIQDFTSHLSFGFGLFLGVVVFRALAGMG